MPGRFRLFVVVMAGLTFPALGCAQISSMRNYLTNNDYRNGTEDVNQIWTSAAGTEGRGDKMREVDPDRWWTQGLMSEKARDIERNLGIDH